MGFDMQFPGGVEQQINTAFMAMHNFFASRRPLFYVYGQNQQLLITDNPNNNAFFNDAVNNATVTNIATSGLILCRVYETTNDMDTVPENEVYVRGPLGTLNITTDITGKNLLDAALLANQQVVFNGATYRVASDSANYGLLNRPFYDYKLSPTK